MCLHGTRCWENLAQSFLSLQDNKDSTAPDTAALLGKLRVLVYYWIKPSVVLYFMSPSKLGWTVQDKNNKGNGKIVLKQKPWETKLGSWQVDLTKIKSLGL